MSRHHHLTLDSAIPVCAVIAGVLILLYMSRSARLNVLSKARIVLLGVAIALAGAMGGGGIGRTMSGDWGPSRDAPPITELQWLVVVAMWLVPVFGVWWLYSGHRRNVLTGEQIRVWIVGGLVAYAAFGFVAGPILFGNLCPPFNPLCWVDVQRALGITVHD